jgi:predicted nucleotidyltransferase
VTLDGLHMPIAPLEYVIVRKLQYFREGGSEKHVRDIRGMLDVSDARIDRSVLDQWIERFDLAEPWRRVTTGM